MEQSGAEVTAARPPHQRLYCFTHESGHAGAPSTSSPPPPHTSPPCPSPDGPLPGLSLIPGFPGLGGRKPGSLTGRDVEQLRRLGMLKLIKKKVKDDDKGLGLGIGRDGKMDLDLGKGLGKGIGDGGVLRGFRFKDDDLFDLGRDGVLSRRGGGGVLGSGAVGGTAAGAIGAIALADYVIRAQDPLAILLRQLSIVAIEAIGTAVANSIDRWVRRRLYFRKLARLKACVGGCGAG